MRLTSIKLSGFKTFVDPETIHLSKNLCAIVGPNGCGKSNIVDAVRWVMGEGSAGHLRGEAMADVIFSGSDSRAPASRARVELLFDNSDMRIGGHYASFSEIAVCRELGLDGISRYFFNGQSCRRRDIFDAFAGTGLGPRSYSIIEQGMISGLIEATPDELRNHLEEAAGISKYKERRRETESRIRQTRQNIERLRDLRDEAARTLEHLAKQVRQAESYARLKAKSDENQVRLLYFKWRTLNEVKNRFQLQLNEKEEYFNDIRAKNDRAKANLAARQTEHEKYNDEANRLQGKYYELNAAIVQGEADLKGHEQQLAQLERDLQNSLEQNRQVTEQLDQGNHRGADLKKQLALMAEALKTARLREIDTQSNAQSAEEALSRWQKDWDEYQAVSSQALRVLDTRQVQQDHLRTQIDETKAQIKAIESEQAVLSADQNQAQKIEALGQQIKALDEARIKLDGEFEKAAVELARLNTTLEANTQHLHGLRTELEQLQGQKSSLEAWLATVRYSTDEKTQAWLAAAGLQTAAYLDEKIKITPAWEEATETVLDVFLGGICVDDLKAIDTLEQLKDEHITLVESAASAWTTRRNESLGLPLLSDRLPADHPAAPLLSQVYEAPDKKTALAGRERLTDQQSIITTDGFWVSRHWIRFNPRPPESKGVLSSTAKVRVLNKEIKEKQLTAQKLQKQIRQDGERAETLRANQVEQGKKTGTLQTERSALESNQLALQVRHKAQLERAMHLSDELERQQERLVIQKERLVIAQNELTEADANIQESRQVEAKLQSAREDLILQLDEARQATAAAQQNRHEKELAYQSHDTAFKSMSVEKQNLSIRRHELSEQASGFSRAIEETKPKIAQLQKALQEKLDRQIKQEVALNAARDKAEQINSDLKQHQQDLVEIGIVEEDIRSELEQLRIQAKEAEVQQNSELERLQETGCNLELIAGSLKEDDNEETLIQQAERLEARIHRLGAINMAAKQEHEEATQRQNYLEEQDADMTTALATLEEAIVRIDKETCTRFKQIFDELNDHFARLFPLFFDGGHARLEMTGDNLLDTGVVVMARPPGKKNSSVKSLSGGEKALTAIALVFSMFELNPAPFCILDEVDAPLDDTNLMRYADLLKEMSQRVQFIYVTHNKITIGSAGQLIGVTMRESGVSRLIGVNLEEAASIVEQRQPQETVLSRV